jgi:hypothetical protein
VDLGRIALAADEAVVTYDHVIVTCNGCGRKRTHYFDEPLHGAEELIAWTKTGLANFVCPCGSSTCDLKIHMQDEGVAK